MLSTTRRAARFAWNHPLLTGLGLLGLGSAANAAADAYSSPVSATTDQYGRRLLRAYSESKAPITTPMRGWGEFLNTAAQLKTAGENMLDGFEALTTRLEKKAAMNTSKGLIDLIKGPVDALGSPVVLGGAVLGTGLLSLAEPMMEPVLEGFGQDVRRENVNLFDRARMDELAAEEFAKTLGRNAGDSLSGMMGDVTQQTKNVAMRRKNRQLVEDLILNDPILQNATPEQADLLIQAYNSFAQTAPTMMSDPFAARNALREVMITGNGPDYATLKNMAEGERALNNRRG